MAPAPSVRAGPRRWKNADAFIWYFSARSAASKAKPVGNRPGSTAVTNANRALEMPRKTPLLFMTLFRLLWQAVFAGVAGRLFSWEAWLETWHQVERALARQRETVWQRDGRVLELLRDWNLVLRPARAVARARPRLPAS